MQKSKIRISIIFFAIISIFGCANQNEIEKIFFTQKNEYWVCYDQLQPYYVFFQFHKDGTTDKYLRNYKGEFELFNNDGDIIDNSRTWHVSKDSILTWGPYTYDVVSSNKNCIVLLYENPNTKQQTHLLLVKDLPGSYRKSPVFYEQKRKDNPAKYPAPFSK